jgi:hypothetical protein
LEDAECVFRYFSNANDGFTCSIATCREDIHKLLTTPDIELLLVFFLSLKNLEA